MAVGEAGGDVEEAVAQRFGFCFGEVTVEADELCSGEQARGEHRDGGPGFVADVVLEWQVGHAGCFPAAHPVLDSGMATMAGFELDDIAVGVGDERGVTPPVVGVEDRELSAGMGSFATTDDPTPMPPSSQVDEFGELLYFCTVAAGPSVLRAGRYASSGMRSRASRMRPSI